MTAVEPLERLLGFLELEAGIDGRWAIGAQQIALGWATVDLDRAAVDLAAALGISADRFVDAPESSALGARCRVASDVLLEERSLVLLEPATEGRLTATLARHDEGPCAIWLAMADLPATTAAMRLEGIGTSVARRGPFGAERLVLDSAVDGPHRLLVEHAGTIPA